MVLSTGKIKNEVFYPISDGKPMADGDKQWKWIVYVTLGFEGVYKKETNVYITSDTFWYPVEGEPKIVQAPDTMITLGRPRGDRDCYKQWEEDNIPPQIVFEIWSPSNTHPEMNRKREFYEKHGVQEYYEYDPVRLILRGWTNQNGKLLEIRQMQGWISPLTKVRFELDLTDTDKELKMFEPNGEPFKTYMEVREERDLARQAQLRERLARLEAEERAKSAEQIRQRELQARLEAEERAKSAEQKLQELRAKLEAGGIKLDE
jgi:Uma2 family endonuclease